MQKTRSSLVCAEGIVAHLEEEFASLMVRKDASSVTLEPRIRNMRYIGELCKFRLISFGTVFTNLKNLLDDFTHHNIDAACALIETAGGFLIRLPETHIRMENMLEVRHQCLIVRTSRIMCSL